MQSAEAYILEITDGRWNDVQHTEPIEH